MAMLSLLNLRQARRRRIERSQAWKLTEHAKLGSGLKAGPSAPCMYRRQVYAYAVTFSHMRKRESCVKCSATRMSSVRHHLCICQKKGR